VSCHVVERPDGVVTPRSVRNCAIKLAGSAGETPQYSMIVSFGLTILKLLDLSVALLPTCFLDNT
jgi:hypothetical protein